MKYIILVIFIILIFSYIFYNKEHFKTDEGYCIPNNLKDIFLIVLFPPLWVFLKELNSPNKDFIKVIYNIIFTSCFYFPGLIHAMNLMRFEGTI